MKLRYLAPAKQELKEAQAYYRRQEPSLGEEFVKEVRAAATRVKENPFAYGQIDVGIRCCRTKRFPYGLVYTVEESAIVLIAVMHLHREPGYWRDRLK